MDLEKAIKHALDGDAIIFTGAGFSSGMKNVSNTDIPFAGTLSEDYLSKELNIVKPSKDLGLISNLYIDKLGKESLIDKLEQLYICKNVSGEASQAMIAKVPWQRVYTTNYDDVFEKASSMKGRKRIPITLSKTAKEYSGKDVILHINGFINELTPKTLMSEFKLSKTSYLVESFKDCKTGWFDIFKSDLDAASTVIFVGVSFEYDIDLQEVIYNSENFKDKIIFIDNVLPSDHDFNDITFNYYKEKFGEVYNIGIDAFAEEIAKISLTHTRKNKSVNFSCFKEVKEGNYIELNSNDIRDLLKMGFINEKIAYFNRNNNSYLINRKEADNILEELKNKTKCICVISGMSSGKTSLITSLSNKLTEIGNVYLYKSTNRNLHKEIKEIGLKKGPVYIILENYNQYLDILSKLKSILLSDNVHLIVTARSFIHDTRRDSLIRIAGLSEHDVKEFYVDFINKDDIDKVINLLESSDYFLDFSNSSMRDKRNIIQKKWNSQFSDILLELIKSPVIEKEIRDIYQDISKSRLMEDLVLIACIFKVFAIDLSLNDFQTLLKSKSLPISFYNDESLNQFIRPANNEIHMQSTVLAKYIVNNFGQENLLDLLNIINENINDLPDQSKIRAVREAIVSFSNLNLLINRDKGIIDFNEIVEFYYNIRNVSFYKKNEFFWLQYGIACLEAQDFERAHANLNQAYKIGREKKYTFDTFQIDTQFARYLLETDLEDEQDSYKRFEKAHELLVKVIMNDKCQPHLVFKRVSKYNDYYERHKDNISNDNKNKMIKSIEYFIEITETYINENKIVKEPVNITKRRVNALKELKNKIFYHGALLKR
ncbi:SIR2 family protein [Sporosarcina sp. Sa2YVA2]|uniref:SIR2 family protein n=1 Tax=Sporosarcina quadrami TaxID=2762234 RepID=A0ABR8U4L2_9BACL|nr:SIR2 family protein [Sporosarcina quadrami]MBD7982976.1 SIR2 family protein [Sporosarcina quadrami]